MRLVKNAFPLKDFTLRAAVHDAEGSGF